MTRLDYTPFMSEAIALASPWRWTAAPNPAVGAVLVKDGRIVASGAHQAFGQPHAEINCLADAQRKGTAPSECTLVVTLEPCNHTGKTGPCAHAIVEAGIKHVVIGLKDPNPIASGGAKYLEEHGVTVETGICEEQCRDLVADFLTWQQKRPFVLLKMASTLDGRIADRTGGSKWISNDASRKHVHLQRARIGQAGGAILVGSGTLLHDNPLLTARDVACLRQPLACSLVSRLPAGDKLSLLNDRPDETILFTTPSMAASPRAAALRSRGIRIYGLNCWHAGNGEDLRQALSILFTEAGCPYVMCEGGGTLALSLLQAGLVDEFHLYLAPTIIADTKACPLFNGAAPRSMDAAMRMHLKYSEALGDDMHLIYCPRR